MQKAGEKSVPAKVPLSIQRLVPVTEMLGCSKWRAIVTHSYPEGKMDMSEILRSQAIHDQVFAGT